MEWNIFNGYEMSNWDKIPTNKAAQGRKKYLYHIVGQTRFLEYTLETILDNLKDFPANMICFTI